LTIPFKPRQHFVRPEEEEEVGEEDSMELQRLARREKNRPVNV
jgi:hypothetical protein